MRVSFIAPTRNRREYINYEMYETLKRTSENAEGITVADDFPDVVHIFGTWNNSFSKLCKVFARRGIPIIFTCIEGLPASTWLGKSPKRKYFSRKINHLATGLHVCGDTEKALIKGKGNASRIYCINNACQTSLISCEEMANKAVEMYKKVIDDNECLTKKHIAAFLKQKKINDDTIKAICFKLLYIKQLLRRGNLPRHLLQDLADCLTISNYDEDKMSTTLKKAGIMRFASRMMYVLNNNSTLTEGFMPIAATGDKQAKHIESLITNF